MLCVAVLCPLAACVKGLFNGPCAKSVFEYMKRRVALAEYIT